MRGSPSPHHDGHNNNNNNNNSNNNNRLRTTGSYQHSPSSHYTSSPSHNYGAMSGNGGRDSSLSPNVDRSASSRSTPTGGIVIASVPSIRTLPKKTAALRQQFSSPTPPMEISNKMSKSSMVTQMKNDKIMDVDASLIRPSALIAPPQMPAAAVAAMGHHHPSMYPPYMYPPIGYLPQNVPPYYHSFYNPAMMAAAAAAAYRFPGMHHPGAIPGFPPQPQQVSAASIVSSSTAPTSTSSYDRNANNQRSTSPASHSHPSHNHHPLSYVHTSPWNPIPLTNHSINNDGNLIQKVKDEPSSGELHD